jgi:cephalosporin-C deacetylase-like acetyl esterase
MKLLFLNMEDKLLKFRRSISFVSLLIALFTLLLSTVYSQNKNNFDSVVYRATDFEIPPEILIVSKQNNIYLQVWKKLSFAEIQRTFDGETAQYNLTISYLDQFLKEPSIDVFINDKKVGSLNFQKPGDGSKDLFTIREKTIYSLDIQKWSKITIKINNEPTQEGTERLHINKFIFTSVGEYQGTISDLKNPEPLRIYESLDEQHSAREMMPSFVKKSLEPLDKKRSEELGKLKTREDWKKHQHEIRQRLSEYFGKFPEKTPLNAKIIDVIEREKYTIEKLIFETQPNYYCSANFYVPKNRDSKVPGVLVTVGHKEEGKSKLMYHELCLGLVLKGYAVLIIDPMGQGERSEYFDKDSKTHFFERKTDQHHYFGRQALMANWSLAGLRLWDGIRAVDYLVSREEVDSSNLAVVGNSGGGHMAMYIAAVDERIKVCAAAHPGGPCERMLLNGLLSDNDIYRLIPPRPFRIIVGNESREASDYIPTIEELKPIYQGFGAPEEAFDMVIVDGFHDIELPKRVPIYEWFNKWFNKEVENSIEPQLQLEKEESLWCSESGFTLISFGGETAQSLNAKRGETIYILEKDLAKLKDRVSKRIYLKNYEKNENIKSNLLDIFSNESLDVEKIIIESEKGIEIPTLLMKPKTAESKKILFLHISDQGKPIAIDSLSIPFELVKKGYQILSIDVRGIGETDPSPRIPLTQYTAWALLQWRRDILALKSLEFKRTMLGMRTFDVLKIIDYIKSNNILKDKSIIIIGEGLGGLWGLLADFYWYSFFL